MEHHHPPAARSSSSPRLQRPRRCRPDSRLLSRFRSMRRSEPLNTSNRLLGGHRRRRTQFGRTRSQGLCRWAVPGLAIFVPPGVSWSPRGLFLNQIVNRVIRGGTGLLWPVPLLFVFAVPRGARPDRTRQRWSTEVCRGWHWQPSALGTPESRTQARSASPGPGGIHLSPRQRQRHGPRLRRKFTPSRNRCCSRTSMFGCSPLPSERRCRKRLPGSPLRFPA